MKKLKKFEEHTVVKKSDIDKSGNWSAEFHVNKKKGLKPFVKKGGKYEEVKSKTIPKNVEYLKPEKIEKYNQIAEEIIKLQEEQKRILE
jgi:hypothetical protein